MSEAERGRRYVAAAKTGHFDKHGGRRRAISIKTTINRLLMIKLNFL